MPWPLGLKLTENPHHRDTAHTRQPLLWPSHHRTEEQIWRTAQRLGFSRHLRLAFQDAIGTGSGHQVGIGRLEYAMRHTTALTCCCLHSKSHMESAGTPPASSRPQAGTLQRTWLLLTPSHRAICKPSGPAATKATNDSMSAHKWSLQLSGYHVTHLALSDSFAKVSCSSWPLFPG